MVDKFDIFGNLTFLLATVIVSTFIIISLFNVIDKADSTPTIVSLSSPILHIVVLFMVLWGLMKFYQPFQSKTNHKNHGKNHGKRK